MKASIVCNKLFKFDADIVINTCNNLFYGGFMRVKKVTKEILSKEIKNAYKESNGKLSLMKFCEMYNRSSATVYNIFGGWKNAISELGLKFSNESLNATKEELTREVLSIYKKYGYLNSELLRSKGKYSQRTYDREFGSFSKLIRELDIKTDKVHIAKGMSNDDILDMIKQVYDRHNELSYRVISKEISISPTTLISRFGNICKIYELLDIEYDPNSKYSFWKANSCIKSFSDILLERPILEWTCNELKNPLTGFYLYVDAYFPKHNLIIEYDGIQHFEFTKYFYKNEKEFLWVQKKDKIKNELISNLGIKLIRIKYSDNVTDNYIKEKLKEKGISV